MTEEVTAPETPEEEKKEKGILVVFRFIFVPLIVVGVVVFIVVLFGQMALKQKSVQDYLYDIRTGSQSERWQAAYHLSNLLANPKKDYAAEARRQLPEMILIFKKAKGNDPDIRRYMALALGRLKDPRAIPALQESVDDEDSQTVLWSLWALGSIGDPQATPIVIGKLESQDPAVRSMSAYVLGALADRRGIPPLQGHLDDSSPEVTWNSAIALARMNDDSGSDILQKLLDRKYLANFPNVNEENKTEAMVNAIKAAAKLPDPELNARIKAVSRSDPSPRVRDAAMQALTNQKQ
jgi:HEAT repeat protein